MENNHTARKTRLEVFDILKEALTFPFKNIKFLIFTILISLPLFFFSVCYETLLQKTLTEATEILTQPSGNYYNYSWSIPKHIAKQFDKNFALQLAQLSFFYLVPLHSLQLCCMFFVVDLASKINADGKRTITLKDRFRRSFITSMYVLSLSSCTLLPLMWLSLNYYIMLKKYGFDVFCTLSFEVAFVVLVSKHLEWSAVWNVSMLISIIEEKVYGVEALALSAVFCRRSKQPGWLLMLVFFVWEIGLRLLCFNASCYESGTGIFVQVCLFWVGSVIKWVACLVYFYDCKRHVVEKEDEEAG